MENYLLLKSLHLLGVVLFLGNIIVTAVWKTLADRTKSPAVVAYSQRLVTITDFVFTAFGVALIYVTGQLLAAPYGGVQGVPWLKWGWLLFLASGAIWVFILIPLQILQGRQAVKFKKQSVVPQSYWRLSRLWAVFGVIATLLPLANLYFMVFKPS